MNPEFVTCLLHQELHSLLALKSQKRIFWLQFLIFEKIPERIFFFSVKNCFFLACLGVLTKSQNWLVGLRKGFLKMN